MKANELMIGDWVQFSYRHPETDERVVRVFQITQIEAQLGDYYIWSEKSGRVCHPEWLQPIPLTPEILEKNGFEKSHEGLRHIEYRLAFNLDTEDEHWMFIRLHPANEKCNIDWARIEFFPSSRIDLNTIETKIVNCSVHHLQHALRLCGIEKTIEL